MSNLIESIKVTIEQIDKTKTPFSIGVSGRREIINRVVRHSSVQLNAQIAHGDSKQVTHFNQIGATEKAGGYCLFLFDEMKALANPLQRGDKITKFGEGPNSIDVEYYLLHSQGDPAAHFQAIGGFTLVRMFFGDRNPEGSK